MIVQYNVKQVSEQIFFYKITFPSTIKKEIVNILSTINEKLMGATLLVLWVISTGNSQKESLDATSPWPRSTPTMSKMQFPIIKIWQIQACKSWFSGSNLQDHYTKYLFVFIITYAITNIKPNWNIRISYIIKLQQFKLYVPDN